jgi:hypothetical protein
MDALAVLPETVVDDPLPEGVVTDDYPVPDLPYVDPVTREAVDLFRTCDRIDTMPNSADRRYALDDLLARVTQFEETVPESVQRTALRQALEMV